MSIDTIVLAIDAEDESRTERLATETIDVAAPTGADVTLVHVFSDEGFVSARDRLGIDPDSEQSTPDAVAKRHRTARSIAEAFSEADVDHAIRGAVGDHAEEIVAVAGEVDADRVLVGGRDRSPTGKAVFGSVAQEVMLSAPCPVTFVRDETK